MWACRWCGHAGNFNTGCLVGRKQHCGVLCHGLDWCGHAGNFNTGCLVGRKQHCGVLWCGQNWRYSQGCLIVIAPHYKLMVESRAVEFYGVG